MSSTNILVFLSVLYTNLSFGSNKLQIAGGEERDKSFDQTRRSLETGSVQRHRSTTARRIPKKIPFAFINYRKLVYLVLSCLAYIKFLYSGDILQC